MTGSWKRVAKRFQKTILLAESHKLATSLLLKERKNRIQRLETRNSLRRGKRTERCLDSKWWMGSRMEAWLIGTNQRRKSSSYLPMALVRTAAPPRLDGLKGNYQLRCSNSSNKIIKQATQLMEEELRWDSSLKGREELKPDKRSVSARATTARRQAITSLFPSPRLQP